MNKGKMFKMDEKKENEIKKKWKRNQESSIFNKAVITGAGYNLSPETTENLVWTKICKTVDLKILDIKQWRTMILQRQ